MLKCLNGCCLLVVKVIELTKCVCLGKISTGLVQSGTIECLVGGSGAVGSSAVRWYGTRGSSTDPWSQWPDTIGEGDFNEFKCPQGITWKLLLGPFKYFSQPRLAVGTVDKKLCNINTKYFTMVHASNIFDWEFSQLFAHCAAFLSDSFCEAQLPFEWLP